MNKRTLGKIGGVAGLVLVLGAPLTYWVSVGSMPLTLGQVSLGAVFLGVFFATNWSTMGQFTSTRGTTFFFTSAGMTVGLVVALIAANYIVLKKNKSWDLTSKKIHSLAPQTTTALNSLSEKVTAIAFMPADNLSYDALEAFLRRYQQENSEKFTYTFKDPRKNPDLAAKYSLKEGQTTVVLTKGEGDKQQQTSLNIISEQELTNALLKLDSVTESKVCFVVGHGEYPLEPVAPSQNGRDVPSVSELAQSLKQEGYISTAINFAGETAVPKDCALVLIAGAKAKFTDNEVKVLETYLDEGGRLAFFSNYGEEPGLDALLSKYGVQVDKGIVADARFAVDSPYNVVTPFFGEHEIGRVLRDLKMNILLPTTRGLSVVQTGTADGVIATPVLTTSPYAWVETVPNEQPQPDSGEKVGQIPVIIASTRSTASAANKRFDEARVVVFGDSDLLVDVAWGNEPNRNLVMNAVAWATSQVNKVTIRPPDRDISTLDIDEKSMGMIRFLSMAAMPMFLLIVGLSIWIARRNK